MSRSALMFVVAAALAALVGTWLRLSRAKPQLPRTIETRGTFVPRERRPSILLARFVEPPADWPDAGRTLAPIDSEGCFSPLRRARAHDELLRALAARSGARLAQAEFASLVPDADGGTLDGWLLARVGEKTYAAAVLDLGDFWDVDATVGFVNALLVEGGQPERWLVVREDADAGLDQVCVRRVAAEAVDAGPTAGEASLPMNALELLAADAGPVTP